MKYLKEDYGLEKDVEIRHDLSHQTEKKMEGYSKKLLQKLCEDRDIKFKGKQTGDLIEKLMQWKREQVKYQSGLLACPG